ncbi:unnamed protein product [Rhodiola kirilowii]
MAFFASLIPPTLQASSLTKSLQFQHKNGFDQKWKASVSNPNEDEKKRKQRPFWRREWLPIDVLRLVILSSLHLMCLYAPFCFTWEAFSVGFAIGWTTGVLGITLSYHRNLTHRSFTLPKWLEYVFAYCGVLALEGGPIDWVSTHRYHHKFADSERDPHSPIEGFWFSHFCWIFDRYSLTEKCGDPSNVADLRKEVFYRFLEKTYYLHPVGVGPLLYAFGGVPYLVLGLGVRIVSWNTGDSSRNNWWVAILTFGEGWHNNHHAFEYSARHGLDWWQLDVTWWIIRVLEALGLATDVKLPTEAHA